MESNDQTELTSEIGTNSQIESRLAAIDGWMLAGERIEQKGKRTHGHGQQRGDCRRERDIRGLHGNGKIQIKIK